jgi:deazaflavin-dependent oxidoreductase (nitroreductase family)
VTLGAVQSRGTLRLTTRGRRTGRPHTVTIWFVVEGPVLWLGTLSADRDWVKNVARTPAVDLDVGGVRLRGNARVVTDPATDAHVRDLLARKYWMAWLGSWFGQGPQRTFRVDDLKEVAA